MVDSVHAKILAEAPLVSVVEDVISAEEAAYIIQLAAGQTARAKVSLDNEYTITDGRTGSNCWLRYDSDPVVRQVGERIAAIAGMPLSHAEAIQVVHYAQSQEYRPHFDAYDLDTPKGQRCCRYGGQRLITALVYLNQPGHGGGTAFPKLNIEVQAQPGRMLLFHNTGENSRVPHPHSLHAGLPVQSGEKWAFNIWFHARPMHEIQHFEVSPISVLVNRAARNFELALDGVRDELATLSPPVCITYWDMYGNTRPDLAGLPPATRVVALIERKISNPLANKASLARMIQQAGLGSLAPPTFETVQAALASGFKPPIWFVKPVFGTAGKGMYCLRHDELAVHELPAAHVVQAGVTDIALDAGKKFTIRLYLLLWNGAVYLYNSGFTMTHGVLYKADSTDYAVQIDHRGYEKAEAAVTVRPGHLHPQFVDAFPALCQLAHAICPLFGDCLAATYQDHYLLLGIDVLRCSDGRLQLIEINTAPNFVHSKEVNQEVNIPFFQAVIRTLVGLEDWRLIDLGSGLARSEADVS
jgi:prolyl 4-hydroxylase